MEIDFAGPDGASMSEALAPACTLLIHLRSISTATERCNRLTDSTSFSPDLILRTIPDKPCSGPSSIRTTCPTSKYGQGIVGRPLLPTRWIAAISGSSTGMGVLPTPTIWITPGVINTGNRLCGFIRQKRYPGKRGRSPSFTRSDYRRLNLLPGHYHSY